MLDSVVADAPNLDLADFNGVLDGPPAIETRLLATIGRVQQEQVNIAKTALLDRLLDGLASRVIGAVGGQLGREMDILALETLYICLTGQVVCHCFSRLLFIVVHLS
jgi:hypothetical protein